MGRSGGITETLSQFLEQAGITLPPWVIPAIIVLLFIPVLPMIRRNSRVHRARVIVQRIASEEDADRALLKQEAIALVAHHPIGLVSLADEAIRRGIRDLARMALESLKVHGRPVSHIHRLHAELHGPPPAHLEGELAAIELLLDNGVVNAAQERLERAQLRWPDAPQLQNLIDRCAEE
jgi:hypothetical protein